jgi:hypothetical protein
MFIELNLLGTDKVIRLSLINMDRIKLIQPADPEDVEKQGCDYTLLDIIDQGEYRAVESYSTVRKMLL